MTARLIFQNIQQHIALTESERQLFESKIKVTSIPRKTFLQEQGQRCRHLFFVEQGCLRAYHINEEGRESTIMFALPNWWITDMNCFINQQPAQLTIETLTDSTIVRLSLRSLNELFAEVPKFEKLFRILFQNAYIREQQRTLQYLSSNTLERYYQFIEKYPAFVREVTQKQIASYLGVTPEFLSTVKKK